MSIVSKINPLLTLEYMQTESENKYLDRKSGQIKPSDLAPHISAFANADVAKAFIADQLREFTKQEHGSGKFVESPEYPDVSRILLQLTISHIHDSHGTRLLQGL